MKITKNSRNVPKVETSTNRKHEKLARNTQGKITDEFQESMREDMRGPLEGMEAVPIKQ